ncbi:Glycosyl hydrolases family 15 [Maioricimonas rarisocia]|uniref:Glycosyl hydrolases family 15 n=1 Tax=Maioricimonas rarisocia TaxID=2528026 RepID=A0A517Z203_9PLAN|nr:glycoside hydrolase family 15 protein [Maioricimonas rarisocia]QDU36513.1 Glycosyl hydrolases family 15 [Maioricimonas rarisocia]
MTEWNTDDLAAQVTGDVTADDIQRLTELLEERGTFRYPALSTGLFSAALGMTGDLAQTGYQNVWVRDNVHVAWGQLLTGRMGVAQRVSAAIMQFYVRHRGRIADVIEGRTDVDDPMNRPHVRFDGMTLSELEERWPHAQNDAIGYFLWLYSGQVERGFLQPEPEEWATLCDLVHYLKTIEYWQDEDSGHWEEARRISASSIGTATAGLIAVRRLLDHPESQRRLGVTPRPVDEALLDSLINQGRETLASILPAECIQEDPTKRRAHDAALLFLIYPLGVVDGDAADKVLADVLTHLQGDYGIRRYLGDSYWCADYKALTAADDRSADFSDRMDERDKLLKPGEEAQWCLFDPIVSIIYGREYLRTGDESARERQRLYLQRSLAQLTDGSGPFEALRCPEAYYIENGQYVPNDHTPLLWAQSNLHQALHWMRETLTAAEGSEQ